MLYLIYLFSFRLSLTFGQQNSSLDKGVFALIPPHPSFRIDEETANGGLMNVPSLLSLCTTVRGVVILYQNEKVKSALFKCVV